MNSPLCKIKPCCSYAVPHGHATATMNQNRRNCKFCCVAWRLGIVHCSSAVRQVRQETINQNCLQSRAEKSRAEHSGTEQSRAKQSRTEESGAEQSKAEQNRAERSGETRNQKLQTLLRGRETGHQLTLQNTIPTVYNLFINENMKRQRQMYRGPWCYSWTDWIGLDGYGWVGGLQYNANKFSQPI